MSMLKIVADLMEHWKQVGLQEGLQMGRREGLQEGLQKSKREVLKAIVVKLFSQDIPLNQIELITGLSAQEIQALRGQDCL